MKRWAILGCPSGTRTPLAPLPLCLLRIIYTIADLQPESGGPSRSIGILAAAVAAQGCEVELVALEYANGNARPMVAAEPVRTRLVACHGVLERKLKWSSGFSSALLKHCQLTRGVVLHDNGLWLQTNHAAAGVARATGIPFIISPRGMLTGWALRFRGLKKRIAWHLYQRRDLQTASVLHATSLAEAEGFRGLGLKHPIAIIPNGVERPAESREQRAENRDRRTVLYLGRIHPIKGLLNLVGAWEALSREQGAGSRERRGERGERRAGSGEQGAWKVVIAGNDEDGHLAEVKAESRKLKVENDFEFVGPVEGEAKWNLYRSADLFVLPSYSENFGLVVAEALACGVPVITTKATPWGELEIHRCGWWIDTGTEPLGKALRQAIGLTDVERHDMGQRGRELVESKYTWPRVAEQMKSVYEWMLGLGSKPDCVLDQSETL